ncbi:cytokine receptor common subunit beta [Sebastes umbrosus]|uniref:cytokine receptor common subunit beta n=1 Tax=Sebastes umbrosus TaxID=72105 RepID=UPI00189F4E10|nr:cytokine receptor common subunit beta [Sebastes umbrosus]XP_037648268.1 cytokine receptor common subunit beta [Sebastes umbrosus]
MMPLLWLVFWSTLPPLVLLCGSDCCLVHESSSSHNASSLLKSLQCHNDYKSYVHCEWREHGNTSLQLWFKTRNNRKQCVPYGAEVQDASEHRTVQCRYEAQAFSIGIEHTVFFLENKTLTLCSSVPHKPLDLSQHLKARPPENLSTQGAGDGGRRLRWSSPYSSSSSLNKHITYQLSYRTHTQDTWTTWKVTNTSVILEKRLLLPGRRYEARVRARASVGQWSDWSPVVTWHTEKDTGQFPSLHCVLDGEKEVMCSWEVSREVAHFITYQLACRRNHTAPSERCCVNPTIRSDLSRAVLRYSCSLTVTDPAAHLLVELLRARNVKSFKVDQHIRPNPPWQVKVRQKDSNWMVEWTSPSTASKLRLYYQVCYYRTQDQASSVLMNISEGSMSLSILGASLAPSQRYQVKVRSLVVPDNYRGIPSEWTDPVDWTTHEATWSLTTLIYFTISVFVAAVFLTLYCTVPACQRRAVLWVDSVPSPGKSKILSEIKSSTGWTLMQSESTTICKVLRLDSVSTCSSDALLWPTKDTEKKRLDHLEQDEGCWKCDNLPSPAEKVNDSDTSSMSFSGPYIFCQSSESKSADVNCEKKEREQETPSGDSASPSPVNFALFGEGYVCLPSRNISRSTQDLVSHSDANTNTHRHDSAEPDQQCPDKMDMQQPGLSEPTSSPQPPAYTSGPFTSWPQGGTTEASGYCHLPAAFMTTANKL